MKSELAWCAKRQLAKIQLIEARLHGSEHIFGRTKTCTVPPCVTWDRRTGQIFEPLSASLGPEKSRSQTCTLCRSKVRPVPPVPRKRKVEPCKFFSVQNFVQTRENGAPLIENLLSQWLHNRTMESPRGVHIVFCNSWRKAFNENMKTLIVSQFLLLASCLMYTTKRI